MRAYPGRFTIKDNPAVARVSQQADQLRRLGQRADIILEELRTLDAIRRPAAFWLWRK